MTSATPARILTSFDAGIGRLTLDNPTRKNAITTEMAGQMEAFCDRVERDETIGAVIVDARGDYFCSGADTRDLAASSGSPASTEAVQRTSAVYRSFVRVGQLPAPSIACVNGGAVGAGLNLALATDLMLITPDAVLDSGFLARHIHPGGGHFHLLGRTLNRAESIAVGALGMTLSGSQAVERGLAWATESVDKLSTSAVALVSAAAADPVLARRIKHSADLQSGPGSVSWPAAVEVERGVQMWSLARKGEAAWSRSSS